MEIYPNHCYIFLQVNKQRVPGSIIVHYQPAAEKDWFVSRDLKTECLPAASPNLSCQPRPSRLRRRARGSPPPHRQQDLRQANSRAGR